jgi:hypothetical protein
LLFPMSLAILTNLLFMALQPLHNVYRFNAMLWYQTTTLQLSNWLSPNNLLRFFLFDGYIPLMSQLIYITACLLLQVPFTIHANNGLPFMFYVKINIKCIHRIFLSFSKFEVLELQQQPTPYEPSLKTTFLRSL